MKRFIGLVLMTSLCMMVLVGCGQQPKDAETVIKDALANNDGSEIVEIYDAAIEQDEINKIEDLLIENFTKEKAEVVKLTPEEMVESKNKYVDFIMLSDKEMENIGNIEKACGIFKVLTQAVNNTISNPVDAAIFDFGHALEGRRVYIVAQELLNEGKKVEAKEKLETALNWLTLDDSTKDVLIPVINKQLAELK